MTCAPELAARRWRLLLRRRRDHPGHRQQSQAIDADDTRERAHASVKRRLLNPPRELDELADWRDAADLVLVDAPCSGSGTWRRNPEGRWRLTPERLSDLVKLQQRLLGIAAELVKPGGRLVYAVCSLLSREGAGQIDRFLQDRSSWISEERPLRPGVRKVRGRLLTTGHDRTDGFFIARLRRAC